MRVILSSILLPLVFIMSAQAQSDVCALKLEEAPAVRGLKLGQSYEDVTKLFPRGRGMSGIRDYQDELGLRQFAVNSFRTLAVSVRGEGVEAPDGWEKQFEGINNIELQFLDDKLAYIKIAYDNSTKWDNPLEFTTAIAQTLKLPAEGWRQRYGRTRLTCDGFEAETAIVLYPVLTIKRSGFEGELTRRRAESEKKRRKVFKP